MGRALDAGLLVKPVAIKPGRSKHFDVWLLAAISTGFSSIFRVLSQITFSLKCQYTSGRGRPGLRGAVL